MAISRDTGILEWPALYDEKYRPQLHFSAPRNWLNDPNGLVWHDGVFHLFYQHNPTGNEWGNMHWGHAVSRNLVEWDVRPVALHANPQSLGFIFSGSAVVDTANRSGLGNGSNAPMIALFTSSDTELIQSQSLAYSLDDGETWTQYDGNPIIENPGIRDFRDPKVFWHAETEKWIMAIAAFDQILFYSSINLIDWHELFTFGKQFGLHEGVWECPDLFPLQTEGGETKWVLVVSVCTEHTSRDESLQYFVGDFDGNLFTPQHRQELWLDWGADNYGAVTWDGVPATDGRRIMIGWMSSWRYAGQTPTFPWRGHMCLPRDLRLVSEHHGYEIASMPVQEIESLRTKKYELLNGPVNDAKVQSTFSKMRPELLDLDLVFSWGAERPQTLGIGFSNAGGELVSITIDLNSLQLLVDRRTVGQRLPRKNFASRFEAPLRNPANEIALRIVKDRASVEVFADNGRAVISANLYFDDAFESVSVFGDESVRISGQVHELRSIWAEQL